jgi:hypothetical protein
MIDGKFAVKYGEILLYDEKELISNGKKEFNSLLKRI